MEELIKQLEGKNVFEQEEILFTFQKMKIEELERMSYDDPRRVNLERLVKRFETDIAELNTRLENVKKSMDSYNKIKDSVENQNAIISTIVNKFCPDSDLTLNYIITLLSKAKELEESLNISKEVQDLFQKNLHVLIDEIKLDALEESIKKIFNDEENDLGSINSYLRNMDSDRYHGLLRLADNINYEIKKYIKPFLSIPDDVMNRLQLNFFYDKHISIILEMSSVYAKHTNYKGDIEGIFNLLNDNSYNSYNKEKVDYLISLIDKVYQTKFFLMLRSSEVVSRKDWQKYIDDLVEYSLFLHDNNLEDNDKNKGLFSKYKDNNAAIALKKALKDSSIFNINKFIAKTDGMSISKEQSQIFLENIDTFLGLDSFKMVKGVKSIGNRLKLGDDFHISRIDEYFDDETYDKIVEIIEDFILHFANINQIISTEQMNFAVSLYIGGLINKDLIYKFPRLQTENKHIPMLFITRLRDSMFEKFLDDESKTILANDYLCEIITKVLVSADSLSPHNEINADCFLNILNMLLSSNFVDSKDIIGLTDFISYQSQEAYLERNINKDYNKVAPTMAALTRIISYLGLQNELEITKETYKMIFDMLMEYDNILCNCQNNEYYLVNLIRKVKQIIGEQKAKTFTKK